MPRPKKSTSEKRNCRLPHLRCTKQEYETFTRQAEKVGLSLSEYGRCLIFKREIVFRQVSIPFDPSLVFQVQAIGNNLNQLTRLSHIDGKPVSGLDETLQRVNLLSEQMLDFLQSQ